MNVGIGMALLTPERNNLNLRGVVRASVLPHSITLSVLLCGLAGVILDLLVLKPLVAISIAVILFTLSRNILESL